jgi:hypothetical protein
VVVTTAAVRRAAGVAVVATAVAAVGTAVAVAATAVVVVGVVVTGGHGAAMTAKTMA